MATRTHRFPTAPATSRTPRPDAAGRTTSPRPVASAPQHPFRIRCFRCGAAFVETLDLIRHRCEGPPAAA